ncbi:MAG TPA: hypothetical protein VEK11_08020 [Thermoanaerobaculia bacterium]|nr:hypothetical protein [Thermoanaerobaculia bacterium]
MNRVLSFLLFAALAAAANGSGAEELTGLWKAKKRFGPDARGTLTMQRTGTAVNGRFRRTHAAGHRRERRAHLRPAG